jgi:hypothetical protein
MSVAEKDAPLAAFLEDDIEAAEKCHQTLLYFVGGVPIWWCPFRVDIHHFRIILLLCFIKVLVFKEDLEASVTVNFPVKYSPQIIALNTYLSFSSGGVGEKKVDRVKVGVYFTL